MFGLRFYFFQKNDEAAKPQEEIVKTDVSKLSKRQKLEILRKESPEFFGLLEDFKSTIIVHISTANVYCYLFIGKMGIAKQFLLPIINLAKDGTIPESTALDFVKIQYQYILKYVIARQPLQ